MITLCSSALLIVLMLNFSVGIRTVLLVFCAMQWTWLLMMKGFLVMFSSGKVSCYKFARDYCRLKPSASMCLALSFTQLHFFVVDYNQGEYYTIEWKLFRKQVPFLWLFARFCSGRPVVRFGLSYRHFRGIIIQFPKRGI